MNLFGQHNVSAHSVYLGIAGTIRGFQRDFVSEFSGRQEEKKPLQSNDVLIAVCSAPVE